MPCPSATLVVWTSAWLHGVAASDDVLDALLTWAEAHEVVAADEATARRLELPVAGERPAAPAMLLAALRRVGGAVSGHLVLPVAGDVRGLGGDGAVAAAALRAGEAAVLPLAGLVVVPERVAEGVLRWTAHSLPPLAPSPEIVGIGEAEHGMTDAVRAATATLVSLDVARHRPNVRAEIEAALRARPRAAWPKGTPGRAIRVLERAAEVEAILLAASGDGEGAAVSASAMRGRTDALRPLADAVRRARCAAVHEAVRTLADAASRRR
ncbi:hypothetical protein LX15_005207 [Streptoalloteichus tenebrarius]|uniref:Uncharacterized protein n=1 Tax=Streptoalloteichus tenebrarius (strain ATCC 17920 / DSM 40477 / JCM 4838 / CBS 697.72 / NBRC 16177 / NCIMB 11028 / NRRL B-12390 / A12253. 1 / ISP 5477) TaxID=1933 RepID=A0ABT1I173_STRSD|nr:hypothetical protein [Streptoalloteichus tenebrarius]MCP2261481.1 hypothetical protein [Streptoalloteichus tenebrarius]BFE99717.1 hypothetical protein GCM10020241_13930 [Streptoalloteichus tenebrarius]